MSTPCRLSARACIANGLAQVRAPIQRMSKPYSRHNSTCSGVATSVVISIPVSSFTRFIQGKAFSPLPSKPPGLVRGFHTPARKMWQPLRANSFAVAMTCCSVSAEQGPAITIGRLWSLGKLSGSKSNSIIYPAVSCINASACCKSALPCSSSPFWISNAPRSLKAAIQNGLISRTLP